MILIWKKYHFYAAHRNELIDDKCKALHGHTYYVEIAIGFENMSDAGITMLFSDIDKKIEPIIKKLDHSTLMHSKDPLLSYLEKYCFDYKDDMKINILPFATSAENLANYILLQVQRNGLNAREVKLRETTTSEIHIKF